jgi:hypothetical protein
MISKLAQVGLAVAVVGGTTVGVSAQAGAAVKPCSIGTWKLLGEQMQGHGIYKGARWRQHVHGGAGIKLTIGAKTASYDFTGSAKEWIAWVDGGQAYLDWDQYTGYVKLPVKVAGNTKGSYVSYGKTATGTAGGHFMSVKPTPGPGVRWNVVANLRKGGTESLIATKATFTCSATQLVQTQKFNSTTASSVETLTYRRV